MAAHKAAKKILIIDDEPDFCRALALRFRQWEFEVAVAHDGLSGLEALEDYRPDFVILDLRMPGMTGEEVCRDWRLREAARPDCVAVPIVVLTADATPEAQRLAKDAGADLCVSKPFQADELFAEMMRLLSGVESRFPVEDWQAQKQRILVVDDEDELASLLAIRLRAYGYEVFVACDGPTGLHTAASVYPDMILLDVQMPGMGGFEFKKRLNDNERLSQIPVIFLTASGRVEDKVAGLEIGADDYVTKPFDARELVARIRSVLGKKRAYEEIAMRDELTGVYNLRFLNKQMTLFFNIARRYHNAFSIAIADLDRFKAINDSHGHAVGDAVLREAAAVMAKGLRTTDIISRYGGDEFVIILTESNEAAARLALKRIQEAMQEAPFTVPGSGEKISMSMSYGIATYCDEFVDEKEMLAAADKDLYRDKKARQDER